MKNYSFFLVLSVIVITQIYSSQAQTPTNLTKLSFSELDSLIDLEDSKSNLEKVISYAVVCQEKAKNEFGTQDSIYASYTNFVGMMHWKNGQFKLAEQFYLESKEIRKNVMGATHPNYASSLNNLAALYKDMGIYEKAEPLFLEAKLIREKTLGKAHPSYATSLNNLAVLYKEMGDFAQAEPLFLEARAIQEKATGKNDANYALSVNNLAILYKSLKRFEEAEALYVEAIGIYGDLLGKMHPSYAMSLNNLATLYKENGASAKAMPLYLEAKNIWKKTLGEAHPYYSIVLNNLANLNEGLGEYSQAEPFYLEAKELRAKIYGVNHYSYTICLNSLARLHTQMNQLDLAWAELQEAIFSSTKLYLDKQLTQTLADSILAVNFISNEDLDKTVYSLELIFKWLEKNGEKEQQLIVVNLVAQLLKKGRNRFSNEKDKLRLLSKSHDWMLYGLNVFDLNKQIDKAFEIIELNKGSLLLEATKTEKAYQLGNLPEELVQEEKQLQKKYSELEASLLENRANNEKDSLRSIFNKLSEEIKSFKQKIELKYPKYAAFKYQTSETKISDIQRQLNDSTAFLEYVVGDSMIYIFYIDKQTKTVATRSINLIEMNYKIGRLRKILNNYNAVVKQEAESYRQYTEQAYWFYLNLLEPVLKGKKHLKNLIIVADGDLAHLPFELFLVKQAPQTLTDYNTLHYLLKDYSISYNYAASLFIETRKTGQKKNSKSGQILAMAAHYNQPSAAFRAPIYNRLRTDLINLPQAQKEVKVLAESFAGLFLLDSLSTEKNFKEKAADYSIIHLAMHGLLDSKNPLLSSLVFSEDGDSLENNFLQAYEISKLELNADLVVLSACETGYGKFEKGNGIASLARAFMFAGVPSLVVSLWPVNDYATSEVMKLFYDNLAQGLNKAEALRQAKLAYINRHEDIMAHPAFWSPFVLIGDESAIYIAPKNNPIIKWFIGGLLLVMLIGIVLVLQKRKTRTLNQ